MGLEKFICKQSMNNGARAILQMKIKNSIFILKNKI